MCENKVKRSGSVKFSKDNAIVETASRSNKTVTKNITPPIKPKEKSKEN